MSVDATGLPSELLTPPQPLIGICGLDIAKNAVHKTVWDAFSNNRKPDRPPAAYKLLPANYDFPVAKPKRTSYEWYHPKGILKRNWMLKHLHVLPAVVVLFQDLEWNDQLWAEKQVHCAATIQALKNALQERNTRICLVLLQKAAPLPPGEDLLATERASSLTVTCGLNTKMLYILPHNDYNIMGYVLRLESAFCDLAQTYYALMSKRIRTHRDQLTTAHTVLKIRHQFKLGFVAEIRQDFNTAVKHYTQAYANLDEIRITDVNCLEIKTIAGFLNYKICRLMFKLKVPRDAINHFISHIEKYKNRTGFKEIIFEHYAWLSTQHSVFAELFCEAIKNGLPALQTQHPGMYYYKAAEFIIKRREAFQQANALLVSPTETNAPVALQATAAMTLFTEYFGIRAFKAGEPMSEQQVNMFVRDQEKSFNHSAAIIAMLGLAMAQFKIYKGPRFRKKLTVDMAEEYFKSGDHANALTLYSLMLPDYRADKWSVIFSDVLFKTLRCALLSASVSDYIACSIEALSLKNRSERKERIIVLENLWKVFACVPPLPHGQIAPELRELWQNAWSTAKTPVPIELDKVTQVLELTASFEKIELQNDEMVNVLLIAKVLTDVPLKIQKFAVMINDGTRSFKLSPSKYSYFGSLAQLRAPTEHTEYHPIESDLMLEPHYYYQILFTTEAKQFFENTQLHVTRIEALMGSDKLAAVLFKNASCTRKPFRQHTRAKHLDDNMPVNTMCYIVPTFHLSAQTKLGHAQMLVNEYFPVTTIITNQYDVFLLNVGLTVSVPPELRNKVFLTTDIAPGRQKLHSQLQIDIGELSIHGSNTAVFYVFSWVATTIVLQQRLFYNLDIEQPKAQVGSALAGHANASNIASITENVTAGGSTDVSPDHMRAPLPQQNNAATVRALSIATPILVEFIDETTLRKVRENVLTIECGTEFKFHGRFYTLNKKPMQRAYRGENFLLRVNLEIATAHDELDILDTYFICDHNLVQSNYSFKRKKFSHTYRQGERLEDVVMLRTNATLDEWITAKEFERNKSDTKTLPQWRLLTTHNKLNQQPTRQPLQPPMQHSESDMSGGGSGSGSGSGSDLQRSLIGKIPNNMTIVNGTVGAPALATASAAAPALSLLFAANQTTTPTMSSSLTSEDGKLSDTSDFARQQQLPLSLPLLSNTTRCIFNRTMDGIQPTGHHRGFIRGIVTTDKLQLTQQSQMPFQNYPHFGIYCIKWRRHGSRDENESKFVINGLDIVEPLLNIYCTIEEKMFVKMPMTFKVVLHNPTSKVLHLIATLSISNIDNFICSGHKQLDVSIFAFGEKELVYNLYPLYVGWQNLPELTLEFNAQVDPSKDDKQNKLLSELVERSMPKRVFVLPPLKQQTKC